MKTRRSTTTWILNEIKVDNLILVKMKGWLSDNQNIWLKARILDRSRKGKERV